MSAITVRRRKENWYSFLSLMKSVSKKEELKRAFWIFAVVVFLVLMEQVVAIDIVRVETSTLGHLAICMSGLPQRISHHPMPIRFKQMENLFLEIPEFRPN